MNETDVQFTGECITLNVFFFLKCRENANQFSFEVCDIGEMEGKV